jgi:Fur family zinc uptake transcriptional regulator
MSIHKKNNQEIVFSVLCKASKPMTAYQILEKLKRYGINAPPTVYRALEALQAQGQVHRIESVNAFVVCHQHEHISHPASFILCSDCGEVKEIHDDRMEILLKEWAERFHFSVKQQTIELLGLCLQCKQQGKL